MHLHPAEARFLATIQQGIAPAEAREADILGYIEGPLASPMWSSQREIAQAVMQYPRVAVASCHGAGKSYTAAKVATAFLQEVPHSIVITTAPTGRQVEQVLWRYIRATAASATVPLRGKVGHPLATRWEIGPDWYALGFKAADTNTDAFQGFHAENILVIVDEAAGVSETLFDAIGAILTGTGARLLLIGNPTSITGTFRQAFHSKRHLWHTITISAEDTPNFTHFGVTREDIENGTWEEKVAGREMPYPAMIDPQYAYNLVREYGKDNPYVTSRLWAEFPDSSEFSLVRLSDIEQLFDRGIDELQLGAKEAGIDVARYGDDYTAIHAREGELSVDWDSWQGFSLTDSHGMIGRWLERRDFTKLDTLLKIDVIGLGSGLAEMMKNDGWRVREVNVNESPSDREEFATLKDELYWQLADRIESGRIGTNGRRWPEHVIAQAADIRYRYGKHPRPIIEPKDVTKKRTGRSPDEFEATVICYGQLPRKPKKRVGRHALGGGVARQGMLRD